MNRPRALVVRASCRSLLLSLTLLAGAAGCVDPVDKAAKERIFSPEDPPKVVASAKEEIPVEALEGDLAATRRVLAMGAAETAQRLGSHRVDAVLKLDWSAGEQTLELLEKRKLTAGPKGFDGDFHASVESTGDVGIEVIRVGGQVYARSRYGRFRHRSRDRGMAERVREEVFGGLGDVDRLFLGRLQLVKAGSDVLGGRRAVIYAVDLAPEPSSSDASEVAEAEVLESGSARIGAVRDASFELPPLIEPEGGADASTLRRRRFHEARAPLEVAGRVWVDAQTGVPLKAQVSGLLRIPPGEHAGEARVKVSLDSSLEQIGRALPVEVPKRFLPDEDKPAGIADTLDRFGIPRSASE